MSKYLVKIGFDCGGPEDGPIMHTAAEMIDAESEADAENQINNRYGYGRDESYCGCSVKLATDEEIEQWNKDVAEGEAEYQSMIDAGLIDPDLDAQMWEEYEKDQQRRDKLIKLADRLDSILSSKAKWSINRDDGVLIDTDGMSDDEVLEYLRELVA